MKSLSTVAFALCLMGCHAGVSPLLTDKAATSGSYAFVVVDADATSRIEARLDRSRIVSRFEEGGHVAYVVASGDETQGFTHLDRATLRIRLRPVSAQGEGTWMSAEVTADTSDAFAEMRAFETSPWSTLEKRHPNVLAGVAAAAPEHALDNGVALELEVDLVGSNPNDATKTAVLYSVHERSPYMTTSWGVSL